MPEPTTCWRTDRPAEGFYTTCLAAHPDRPVRAFLPTDYQPKYPYPLVVLLHGHGGTEDRAARLAPRVSRRNYIAVSPRGPVDLGCRPDGTPRYGWGTAADAPAVADYVLATVRHALATYHVHPGRVFLVGLNEGAEVAYRVGLEAADRIAGVAALNGRVPAPAGRPLFRLRAVRDLPVLIAHGSANALVPFDAARRDQRLLYTAGADARLVGYPTTHKIHPHMLRDLNRWLMGRVTSDVDAGVPV